MKSSNAFAHLRTAWCAYSLLAIAATAAPPVVKTVPWVASNPLIPHTTFASQSITLKGTADQQGPTIQYSWDFGDGSAVATGNVSNQYAIEAKHTYVGAVGTVFTARLTVQNTGTGESGSKTYYVQMFDKNLSTEVNVAIDEGLWYLHKTQTRSGSNDGAWTGGFAGSGYYGVTAVNVNAFEVNGHLESGSPDDPYTDTVHRALLRLFAWLVPTNIGMQAGGNPDTNGNGIGIIVNQSYPYYQGGMFMDTIVASGTPSAVTTTGPANVVGRTYKAVVQDMVDAYSYAQYDAANMGGWRYNTNDFPDNSACQWAAIGMIAAEKNWGCIIPAWVKSSNIGWLAYSQNSTSGVFGYTDANPIWGPYATTPSGMVQMALDGIGRGSGLAAPSWEKAETFMRNNFGNSGGPTVAVKDYYYGMFSFVKSLLLHNVGGVSSPIVMLHSTTAGVPDIDWYAAEASKGAPTDGVARTLVNDQNANGYWSGHNYDGNQYVFETAQAVIMLHQTLFESGVPVAVAKAVPNPAVAGQNIVLDGSDSYHQDPTKHIVKWEWDLGSGTFANLGPTTTTKFTSVGTYPVKLQVTDNVGTTAQTVVNVLVAFPPLAPTADADGPYNFCPAMAKWYLDARASTNPDEGQHEPGKPGDTIGEYSWDLNGDNVFGDVTGPTPDVKPYFTANHMGTGSYLVSLRVTDTTATSYPSSGQPNLSSTATAVVVVHDPADEACACVTLAADGVLNGISLSWTAYPGAVSYNVYRSDVTGGPYLLISNVSALAFIDHSGGTMGPLDQTYYYVVRPALLNGDELCQSNETSARPIVGPPTVTVTRAPISNVPFYYVIDAHSLSFGHMQLWMHVKDSAGSLVVDNIMPGATIYVRTHYPVASVRDGSGAVVKYITVKGSLQVWATDPLGHTSDIVTIP